MMLFTRNQNNLLKFCHSPGLTRSLIYLGRRRRWADVLLGEFSAGLWKKSSKDMKLKLLIHSKVSEVNDLTEDSCSDINASPYIYEYNHWFDTKDVWATEWPTFRWASVLSEDLLCLLYVSDGSLLHVSFSIWSCRLALCSDSRSYL